MPARAADSLPPPHGQLLTPCPTLASTRHADAPHAHLHVPRPAHPPLTFTSRARTRRSPSHPTPGALHAYLHMPLPHTPCWPPRARPTHPAPPHPPPHSHASHVNFNAPPARVHAPDAHFHNFSTG